MNRGSTSIFRFVLQRSVLKVSTQVTARKFSSMGLDQSKLLGPDYPISLCNCRIVVVGAKSGDPCLLALSNLPPEARIIATGNTLAEIQKDGELYSEVQYFYV